MYMWFKILNTFMCKKKNSDTYEFADRSLQLSFKQQFGHRLKSVV